MAGVVDALVLQAEASDLGGGDTLGNITRSEALKEKCENEFNEVKTTKDVPDSLSNAESSDPEDIRAPMSRESPSPCSHGKPRCSAYVRPLITAAIPTAPAESPSEQWLVHCKRLKKATFTSRLLLGHHDMVRSVAVDQNLVVSASDDTTVRVWSVQAGRELCSLRGHTAAVNAVLLLSSDQTEVLCSRMECASTYHLAVSGSSDACLNVWLALEGRLLKSMYTYNAITALAAITEDCHIVVGTEGGKLEVWDVAKGAPLSSVIGHDGVVVSIRVDITGTVFTASSDGSVKVWQWLSKELCAVQVHDALAQDGCQLQCLAVSGRKIFVGRDTAHIRVIDWSTGRIDYLKNHPHDYGSTKAVFVKDSLLLSTSFDKYSRSSTINMRTLPGGAYVGTLKCGGRATAVTLASDLVDDSTLRIVVGGTRLEVFDWAPFQNSGDSPVLYLETLAECAQGDASDGNESNKSHSPSEMQLKPYQDSSTAEAPGNWCSIM